MSITLLPPDEPSLRQPSVAASKAEAKDIIKKLEFIIEHVTWGNAVGMAAPQIGINKRVFIAQRKEYINPTIIWKSDTTQTASEGCYSVPHKYLPVERSTEIKVEYYDRNGTLYTEILRDFPARVFQHEYDHIEGILIKDRNQHGKE